ncbi:MAG: helix-turn-helix transcriptional regulator [Ruminococcaceae bacterium]|nr:helix-turn-helix transcriptional regulator [Oscillospiraceae bacterium]
MPTVNEYEGRILELLLSEGSMTPSQLAAYSKKAFGWKRATLRAAQQSLLRQGLITLTDGKLCAAITQEAFRELNWNQWISGSFDWAPAPQPQSDKKRTFYQNFWFWTTCAATIIAVVLLLLPLPKSPQPTSLPEESVTVPSFPEELVVCREALDEWQALDSYMITVTLNRLSSSSNTPQSTEQYWVSENNWVFLNYASSSFSTKGAGHMFRDGNLYTTSNANNPIWTLEKENLEAASLGLWPMVFDWDKFELRHLETTKSNSDTMVRCSAKSREGITTVYELQFRISSSGKLQKLTVIQTKLDGIITKDIYTLSSSDAEEIAQYISDQREISFSGGFIPSGDIPE